MAEPSASESSPETDRDFDLSAEMLVNDFDDERTLEEEEAMESGEDVQNELDELQKEGDMPLEDLLAIYGGYTDGNQADTMQSSSSEEILSNQDLTLDKDEIARDLLPDEGKCTSVHELLENMDTSSSSVPNSRLLRSSVPHHQSESESESEDEDYVPDDDDWKKTIQVGCDYQAAIPDGLCKYDGAPAYENEDKLLWDPYPLEDTRVDCYLGLIANMTNTNNCSTTQTNSAVAAIPSGAHVRDDEQALYLLLQCGHNIEEAQRRRRMQSAAAAAAAAAATDTMSLWSEEECRCFENGLRTYGKDFHLIQQNRVRTRSVGELVQFYYLWKKTERHDVFANKARLEKKKYSLHPGTTDYMDRFLDEHENPPTTTHRDRSSSPSIHSLISGDHKRQQHLHHHHHQHPPHHPYHHPHRQSGTTEHHAPTHFDGTGAFPLPAEFNLTDAMDSINNSHHPTSLRKNNGASSIGDVMDAKHQVLAPTLEDLAKNLSQGLEHDAMMDSLTSSTSSNNEFSSELNHRNNYHQSHRNQMNSLKSIDMSIASVNNNSISSESLIQASAASSFAQ